MPRIAFMLALPALLISVSACGLRGDLERPGPLFGPIEGDAPEAELVGATEPFEDEPDANREPRFNEFGGVIPNAAPSEPVEEGGLAAPQ